MLNFPATAEWKVQKAGLRLKLVQGRGPDRPFSENVKTISSSSSFSSPLLFKHRGIEAWKGRGGPEEWGWTWMCCRPSLPAAPPPPALQFEALRGQKRSCPFLSDLPSPALRQKRPSRFTSSSRGSLRLPLSSVYSVLWVSLKCCYTSALLALGEAAIPSCLDCDSGSETELPASCWWLCDRPTSTNLGLLGLNLQGLPLPGH